MTPNLASCICPKRRPAEVKNNLLTEFVNFKQAKHNNFNNFKIENSFQLINLWVDSFLETHKIKKKEKFLYQKRELINIIPFKL